MEPSDFLQLAEFEDPGTWGALTKRDRVRLAKLFIWRAEFFREKGGGDPEPSLAFATQVAPDSTEVLYRMGKYWLEGPGLDAERLAKACSCFEAVTSRNPKHSFAWWGWAVAKTHKALLASDVEELEQSELNFSAVNSQYLRSKRQRQSFYWDWGFKWFRLAQLSGEAIDFRRAVQKFELAQEVGLEDPAFLIDYGQALLELSELVSDRQLVEKALGRFIRVVQLDEKSYVGWGGVARTLDSIFDLTGDEDALRRACQAYEAASMLASGAPDPLFARAFLLLRAGEELDRVELVKEALEGLESLQGRERFESTGLSLVVKGLILLGSMEERLDCLYKAQELAKESLKGRSTDSALRCLYGDALCAQGHYFGDLAPFRQATEQYARALAADPGHVGAHLGMAQASYALGAARQEPAFLEKAARHLKRATELDSQCADAWSTWALVLLKWSEITDQREEAVQAIGHLQRALSLTGGIADTPDLELLFNYGCALDYLGGFGEDEEPHRQAVEVLTRVINEKSGESLTHFHLALAWFHIAELTADLDEYRQAMENFELAASLDPEEDLVWDEWGCALLHLAQIVADPSHPERAQSLRLSAEEKFRRAAILGRAEAYYHMAWVYCLAGDNEQALEALRRAHTRGALPSIEQLLHDEWLAELREQPEFAAFVASL